MHKIRSKRINKKKLFAGGAFIIVATPLKVLAGEYIAHGWLPLAGVPPDSDNFNAPFAAD